VSDHFSDATISNHPKPAQEAASEDLAQLRFLLVGPEQEKLARLQERLDNLGLRAADVSQVLAEAIRIRASRDNEIGKSLSHVIENVLRNLVRQEPAILADTIYPIIGRSIRKAIAAALQDMTQSVNRVVEQSLSLRGMQWRLEAWRAGKSYGEIVLLRSLLYKVEQVFLIHKKTGLLLQQVAASDLGRDPDLVAAMLAAIQDFVRDSFAKESKDELDTIQVGELGIWIQHGPFALLAGVVRGVAPRQLSTVFHETLERIHKEQESELKSFVGDPTVFESSRPYLDRCLLGSAKPKKQNRRFLAWALAGIALLAIIFIVTLQVRSARDTRRWTRYIERLQAEPGILVTNAERRKGHYRVHGLRDPLSQDPMQLLNDAKIDPQQVSFQWEPFLSQHPQLAIIRRFEQQRFEVERSSIYFNLGSAEILQGQLGAIENAISSIRSLFATAEVVGRRVRLEVVGHSDALGAREMNSRLSRERASVVLRLLIAKGIPEDRLLTQAEAMPDASKQTPAVAGAEMDRRVSFRVEFVNP
jgi:outer membrane protein OmpA-like peptidoglycan-associated protein